MFCNETGTKQTKREALSFNNPKRVTSRYVFTESDALGGQAAVSLSGCVYVCSLCMTLSFQNDSTAEGGVQQCAAFPCYICKGGSYTYFLLTIKENMFMLSRRLVFCRSQSCPAYSIIVGLYESIQNALCPCFVLLIERERAIDR